MEVEEQLRVRDWERDTSGKRRLRPVVVVLLALVCLLPARAVRAEQVSKLPAPTGYVSDFAGVLSPETVARVDNLCLQLDRQAKAQVAVVMVKSIQGDDGSDESIEEFATALEDKWKVGAKGTDRGVLMLFVTGNTKGRIEVGYGLEGILNDAKVGDIGRSMAPAAKAGDYDSAVWLGTREVAQVIATDAGVTLQSPQAHQYHYQQTGRQTQVSLWQVLLFGGVMVVVLIVLASTGNLGLLFFLLLNMLGGGGGGGGGRNDRDGGGGGFGGFGGGGSGGGGASGDW